MFYGPGIPPFLLLLQFTFATLPPPSNIHVPTAVEYTSLHLPVWTNMRQLVSQIDKGILNHTSPASSSLLLQLRREAKELRSIFSSSSRTPRSLLSFLGIASESEFLKSEMRLSDLASAQRDLEGYLDSFYKLFVFFKDALLEEETKIEDLVHIQSLLLRTIGTSALMENLRQLTRLFRELNKLAAVGTTGPSSSDVLHLPSYSYLVGFESNSSSVTLHLILPIFELFIYLSILPFIHSSIHLFIHSSIRPFIHSSIHPFIHSSIHLFIHSSIHPSIHPYIITYIQTYIHTTYIYTYIYLIHDTDILPCTDTRGADTGHFSISDKKGQFPQILSLSCPPYRTTPATRHNVWSK